MPRSGGILSPSEPRLSRNQKRRRTRDCLRHEKFYRIPKEKATTVASTIVDQSTPKKKKAVLCRGSYFSTFRKERNTLRVLSRANLQIETKKDYGYLRWVYCCVLPSMFYWITYQPDRDMVYDLEEAIYLNICSYDFLCGKKSTLSRLDCRFRSMFTKPTDICRPQQKD